VASTYELPAKKALQMNIYIKNMVSARCKMAVQSVLKELKIDYLHIELGEVKLAAALTPEQQQKLKAALKHYELELMDDKKRMLVEQIKALIIETFHTEDNKMHLKLSVYLSKHLIFDYTHLANTFSEMEGMTIERFFIASRIERVKDLIANEALSINEIAYQLNYSSVAHLSLQFKKVTGQTLSMFRKSCESPDYIHKMRE
jgi:AraC-like DNA-binding protein